MSNQAQQPSPCPECGGARVMVGYRQYELFPGHTTVFRGVPSVPFWAVCCTRCGHMTQYANQEFIAQALEVTVQEQQELAQRAAREQKRQEKKGLC